MSFTIHGPVVFVPNGAGWKEFTESPSGTVGSDIRKRGYKLALLAARSVNKSSGRLAASISSTFIPGHNPSVLVGSNLKYALFVHEGTRPHVILPHHGRLLRFKVHGKIVYAQRVLHPGTRPTKYLTRHLAKVVK